MNLYSSYYSKMNLSQQLFSDGISFSNPLLSLRFLESPSYLNLNHYFELNSYLEVFEASEWFSTEHQEGFGA